MKDQEKEYWAGHSVMVHIQVVSLTICMASDKLFNFSKSQSPHLQSGSDENHLEVLPRSLSKLTHLKHTLLARNDTLRAHCYCHCLLLLEETEFALLIQNLAPPPSPPRWDSGYCTSRDPANSSGYGC